MHENRELPADDAAVDDLERAENQPRSRWRRSVVLAPIALAFIAWMVIVATSSNRITYGESAWLPILGLVLSVGWFFWRHKPSPANARVGYAYGEAILRKNPQRSDLVTAQQVDGRTESARGGLGKLDRFNLAAWPSRALSGRSIRTAVILAPESIVIPWGGRSAVRAVEEACRTIARDVRDISIQHCKQPASGDDVHLLFSRPSQTGGHLVLTLKVSVQGEGVGIQNTVLGRGHDRRQKFVQGLECAFAVFFGAGLFLVGYTVFFGQARFNDPGFWIACSAIALVVAVPSGIAGFVISPRARASGSDSDSSGASAALGLFFAPVCLLFCEPSKSDETISDAQLFRQSVLQRVMMEVHSPPSVLVEPSPFEKKPV